MIKKLFNSKIGLPLVIVLLVAINWLASAFHGRIDFTSEKRFTLSQSTRTVLKNLDGKVDITVFLAGDIKSEFKKLANSTKELLENFKNYGGSKIQYQFELPGEGLNDSLKAQLFDSLINMGLRPTTQQVQTVEGEGKIQRQVFPGAIIRYGDTAVAVDFLQGQVQKTSFNSSDSVDKKLLNNAEALLEFKFANAIKKITQKEVPVVAYTYGNGEPPYGFAGIYSLFETLGQNYSADIVDLHTDPFISAQDYSTLVIVKPTEKFTDDEKFKLDQYVMNGGNLLFFVSSLYTERDSLKNGELIAYSRDLNLNDLLFHYGARINTDIIADKYSDKIKLQVGYMGGQPQYSYVSFPYAPLLQPGSEHSIVKNQADVMGVFVNSVDTVEAENIKKTILLASSPNAYTFPTPAQITLSSLQTIDNIKKFNKKNIPVAVLLEGKFTSLFTLRKSQSQEDTLKAYGQTFAAECKQTGRIIVAGNADIVMSQFSEALGRPLTMGVNKDTKVQYANKDFFLNCLEYLANKNNILDSRAKGYTLRLLDAGKVASQRSLWQIVNIVAPILLVCLFALFYQWRRKRKYTAA